MRIILATGIFYPEIGGPALLVKKLAEEFSKKNHQVVVITYGQINQESASAAYQLIKICRRSKIFNYFRYFLALLKTAKKNDLVLVFDTFSAALPVAIVSFFRGFRFFIRLGGDFLWETAVNKFGKEAALTDYYRTKFNWRERLYFFLIKFIFKRAAKLIATAAYQSELVKRYYQIPGEKFVLIPNAFPQVQPVAAGEEILAKQIIYVGRFNPLKNLFRLIEAFKKANLKDYRLILVGDGPLGKQLISKVKEENLAERVFVQPPLFGRELDRRIQESRLLVLPSLSDITPNSVLRAIALGTPVLMTKHSGYFEEFKDKLLFIDEPKNIQEIQEKISFILEEENYLKYKNLLKEIDTGYTEEPMAEKYLNFILL